MKDKVKNSSVALVEKLGEVGIDSLIESNQVLKDVPILGSIVGVFKLGNSISDSLLLSKVKMFVESIGDVSYDKRIEFNEKMSDEKEFRKTSRMLLYYMDNFDTELKSALLGHVFTVYLNESMGEEVFRKFASLIDKMNYDDLKKFIESDGQFDWLYAHDYIANGLAMFVVPKVSTLDDINCDDDIDQTGMTYGCNPWGAEVIRVLGPYFECMDKSSCR